MADKQALVGNRLDGPFRYNVYLSFAAVDLPRMESVQRHLERQNIVCHAKYDAADLTKELKSHIDDGINSSEKCVVYMSEYYTKDFWYQMESKKILNKANRFSRDVVIILKDPNLRNFPLEFEGFQKFEFQDDDNMMRQLGFEILREPNEDLTVMPKENIGYGSALGYYYGFLRMVLPDFRQRLEKNTLNGDKELSKRTVKKMFLIMPESCFCPPQFTEEGKIEHTDKFVVRVAHRAGNKNRDYKSSLYRIIDTQDKSEYYFVGELATPLLTMFESYFYGLAGMTRDQLYAERDAFYVALKAILSHPNNSECNGQFKLLFWTSDPETKRAETVSAYDFLLPIIREEVRIQQESVDMAKATDEAPQATGRLQPDFANHGASGREGTWNTFELVPVDGPHPGPLYEDHQLDCYSMKKEQRGICLIINIAKFEKGHQRLTPRRGAEADVDKLKELFEKKQFTVQVHSDLMLNTLETLLLTTSSMDHSNYDAFVCCFLTHGKLGVLYTSDAKPVRILDIVDFFSDDSCPTLRGKPKMFFIQACQHGGADNGGTENGGSHVNEDGVTYINEDSTTFDGSVDKYHDVQNGLDHKTTLDWDASIVPVLCEHKTTWAEGKATLVPSNPDILMSYATLPGAMAYRDIETGSLYTNELAKCLDASQEIDRALKMVTLGVTNQLKTYNNLDQTSRFQLPFHLTSGMYKLIRL